MSDFIIKTDNTAAVLAMKNAQVQKALTAIGIEATKNAKAICPVDTGRLRSSINSAHDGETVYVGTNVEYAPYVELGAQGRRAQPYLKPAIENHLSEYKAIFDKCLKD